MKTFRLIIILLMLLDANSCIIKYVPKIDDYEEVLIIEGLITDQPAINTIKISKSQPIWTRKYPKPLTKCLVIISDDQGQKYTLKETSTYGVYITDPARFRGAVGRVYTLHIRTTTEPVNLTYESLPVKMVAVPCIDSIYYEKKIFTQSSVPVTGCNIYLNTHDPANNCRFYRWEYSETWEFHHPLQFPFNYPFNFPDTCWITTNPAEILIKNASLSAETDIVRYPVISISNPSDRFSVKYSILVNQFSLNEDEYFYWERLKNSIDQTGGLYDRIPTDIPNNIYCLEEPNRKVLGYFSVSAMSSRRLFIKDNFPGVNPYAACRADTIFSNRLDTNEVLIIKDNTRGVPPYIVYLKDIGCVDCTTRGTNIKPSFWVDNK